MWGAILRKILAYMLTRRGKRALAFAGMMSACFLTALLLDTKLYISAAFTSLLAGAMLTTWLTQYLRVRQQDREREVRRVVLTERRQAAIKARGERLKKVKAAMVGNARALGEATATRMTSVRDELRLWPRRQPVESD